MKHFFTLISGFTLVLFTGCGSSENDDKKAETPAVNTSVNPNTSLQPATNTAPAATTTLPTTTNTIPVTTTSQPTAAGLNPAHGQPGHRCDISVGAPLNSAPRPATTTTTTPAINTTTTAPATLTPSIVNTSPKVTTTPVTTQAAVAPGMNPAHGQPGHRCDISVGAPLNSPVKSTTVTTTPVKQ